MTHFEIARLGFSKAAVKDWMPTSIRSSNWPIMYVLDSAQEKSQKPRGRSLGDVYVGETINAAVRMRQHLESPDKKHLATIRAVVDETYNKSVCLDLESYLIRLLAGDGRYRVLNRNDGITDSDYYQRDQYQEQFREVFEELKREGIFARSIPGIENSDLFKLSPHKSLSHDQAVAVAVAVEDILEGLFGDLESGASSTIVVQGDPGTGKTVVAICLLKLLHDIAAATPAEDLDSDSLFSEFVVEGYRELLEGRRIGFVIPQQALRQSVKKVFGRTPALSAAMVLTRFEVGNSEHDFDLLVVDETHRLDQRANQSSGVRNKKFIDINKRLFGGDDLSKTQLDWIRAKSKHQLLLVDAAQSVRPADLPPEHLHALVSEARVAERHYPLTSQMRVQAGSDYVAYIRRILSQPSLAERDRLPTLNEVFDGYDFRMFDSLGAMQSEIRLRDAEHGLARLVAGFAWEWKTKKNPTAYDIEVDGCQLRWNGRAVDWIASKNSLNEVGSIHTVQGYDLNYAGVIIGPDLRYDATTGAIHIDRASYFDKKGKENNPVLGKIYTDDDLLRFITNIYAVLLTRGIRGTYVYVCDPALREHLRQFIPLDSR